MHFTFLYYSVCVFIFLFLVPEKNMYTRSQVTYIQLPFFTLSFAFSSSNVFLHYPRTINNVMKAVKRKRGGGATVNGHTFSRSVYTDAGRIVV